MALVAKSILGGKASSWWLSLLLLGVGLLGMKSRGWCENRLTSQLHGSLSVSSEAPEAPMGQNIRSSAQSAFACEQVSTPTIKLL